MSLKKKKKESMWDSPRHGMHVMLGDTSHSERTTLPFSLQQPKEIGKNAGDSPISLSTRLPGKSSNDIC